MLPPASANRMSPILGTSAVSKARRSLLCSLCKQPYGACIQCAGSSKCYAAFHATCARDAGLKMCATYDDEDSSDPDADGGSKGGSGKGKSSRRKKRQHQQGLPGGLEQVQEHCRSQGQEEEAQQQQQQQQQQDDDGVMCLHNQKRQCRQHIQQQSCGAKVVTHDPSVEAAGEVAESTSANSQQQQQQVQHPLDGEHQDGEQKRRLAAAVAAVGLSFPSAAAEARKPPSGRQRRQPLQQRNAQQLEAAGFVDASFRREPVEVDHSSSDRENRGGGVQPQQHQQDKESGKSQSAAVVAGVIEPNPAAVAAVGAGAPHRGSSSSSGFAQEPSLAKQVTLGRPNGAPSKAKRSRQIKEGTGVGDNTRLLCFCAKHREVEPPGFYTLIHLQPVGVVVGYGQQQQQRGSSQVCTPIEK